MKNYYHTLTNAALTLGWNRSTKANWMIAVSYRFILATETDRLYDNAYCIVRALVDSDPALQSLVAEHECLLDAFDYAIQVMTGKADLEDRLRTSIYCIKLSKELDPPLAAVVNMIGCLVGAGMELQYRMLSEYSSGLDRRHRKAICDYLRDQYDVTRVKPYFLEYQYS